MVSRHNQWEEFVENSLVHLEANAFLHDQHAVDEFGIGVLGPIEQ